MSKQALSNPMEHTPLAAGGGVAVLGVESAC